MIHSILFSLYGNCRDKIQALLAMDACEKSRKFPLWWISCRVFPLVVRGGKNRGALLAGNVKQLQEICLNEDLQLKI
jgi:hypothetical protein